ncbi:hypothetical protein RI129_002073 [Pyrocoelia pectoralis]|uniref:Uncharacterized protein n=1 Tax=Pyrocoelia pectoralis TaxID=417401 RepID=A0AAN7ZSK8_9COLE
MKVVIILTIFSIPLLVANPIKHDEICLSQLNLNENVMKPLLQQVYHPIDESEDYNAFLKCFWKAIGYMADDGTLYWDDIRLDYEAKFGKSTELMGVITDCKNKRLRGSNPGETAVKNQNCLMEGVVNRRLIG